MFKWWRFEAGAALGRRVTHPLTVALAHDKATWALLGLVVESVRVIVLVLEMGFSGIVMG